MLQCIYLQWQSARKHVRGYSLGTSVFNLQMQGVRAGLAETANFPLLFFWFCIVFFLYVKPLELEFVFGFIRHKRISKGTGPD